MGAIDSGLEERVERSPKHRLLPISLAFIILLAAFLPAHATDYYIAANGSDNNNGTSPTTPFQTIAKLNTMVFKPGDTILFKRGDTFRGQLNIKQSGTASKPLTVTAYGHGALPDIRGSEYVNQWSLHKGRIYQAALDSSPVMVFHKGSLSLPARYPNSGFLTIDKADGKKGFYDAALKQPDGYWNGATLHNRMVRWQYGEHSVRSFVHGYIATTKPLEYAEYDFRNGWGYFLSNKMEALDAAGEFFYDSSQHRLYLWSASRPADNSAEASIHDYGIYIENANYVRISHIGFRHQRVDGVCAGFNKTGISVQGCRFQAIYSKAIYIEGVDHVALKNNIITDILGQGILASECRNIVVQDNTIKRIGLYAGRATKNEWGYSVAGYSAIEISGRVDSGIVSSNVLDSIGYSGLIFSKNTLIEKNLINNYCLIADDGGAVYTNGAYAGLPRNGTGCVIRNNIIQNGIGNLQATTDKTGGADGIYMDDGSGDALILNNTVVHCSAAGIFLHNSSNNTIRGNTLFDCRYAPMSMSHDYINATPVADNTVTKNILYSVDENSFPLILTNYRNSHDLNFAAYAGNSYCNPYNPLCIYTENRMNNTPDVTIFTVGRWKALKDAGAKSSHVRWDAYFVTDVTSGDLMVNGGFDYNLDGWWCWSPTNTSVSSWGINSQLDNGSWHLQGSDGCAFNLNYYFGLEAGQAYQLSLSTIALAPGTIALQTADANTYQGLEMKKNIPVDSRREDHRIIFTPTSTTNPARINIFQSPSAPDFWLDNIRLVKVEASYDDPLKRNLIYINKTKAEKTFVLPQTLYDLDDHAVSGSLTLPPYTSKILLKK